MSDIKPYAKNAKKHPQSQIDLIVDSLKNNDYYSPLGIDETGELVIGHGRYEALKQLKSDDDLIEVVDFSYLDKKQIKKLRIMDNKIVSDEWDNALLEEELKAIVEESDGDLEELANEMGLSDKELSSILPEEETVGDDDVPEDAPSMTKEGDLWELGEHRLLCGDSTKEEDVARLMDGQKADMVFTDPPYNVAFNGRSGKFEVIKNDDLSEDAFNSFIGKFLDILKKSGVNTYYLCCNWAFYGIMQLRMKPKSCIVWAKNVFGLGKGYRHQHEFILFDGFIDPDIKNESDLWEIKKDINYKHPTQK